MIADRILGLALIALGLGAAWSAMQLQVPFAADPLGPSPFPRSGFPFLGFLASVYDHVETHVGQKTDSLARE